MIRQDMLGRGPTGEVEGGLALNSADEPGKVALGVVMQGSDVDVR